MDIPALIIRVAIFGVLAVVVIGTIQNLVAAMRKKD